MPNSLIDNRLFRVSIIILVIAALVWPAIDNGYPLVYSDSGSYIASGHLKTVPIDRPIAYGLFVNFFSLNLSLWLVILAQASLLLFTVHILVRQFVKPAVIPTCLILIFLSFTTGISNFTSQIMADIFSGIAMIGFTTLVLFEIKGWQKWWLGIITIFSLMTHFSNVLVCLMISSGLVVAYILNRFDAKLIFRAFGLSLAPIVLTLMLNSFLTGEAYISKTSNVFIVARIAESGVLKDFLAEKCATKQYIFCNQLESIPDKGFKFLWFDDSPLYDEDCRSRDWTSCWLEKNHACGWILKGLVQSPKHALQLAKVYSVDFLKQVADFDIGVLDPQREHSSVQDWIKIKFPNELNAYVFANQYGGTLRFEFVSLMQKIIVYLSFLGLLILAFTSICKSKPVQSQLANVVMLSIGFLLANAAVVVVFSTVLDRYQSRLIWIVPFLLCLVGAKLFEEYRMIKTKENL